MAWLPGYAYRKPLVLTGGASGAQTDFQLDIDIAYVAAKMQADFDDIRFTQNDGTTLIDAWLESKVDSTSAKTWAEFPTTPANTVTHTYYMYYGKVVANYWDIGATFLFGDDFPGVSIDTNKWEYDTGSVSVSGGIATLSGGLKKIHAKPNVALQFIAETRSKVSSDSVTGATIGTGDESNVTYPYIPKNGIFYYTRSAYSGDVQGTKDSAWMDPVPEITIEGDLGVYQTRKFFQTSTNIKVYYDDNLEVDHSTDIPTVSQNFFFSSRSGEDIILDWAFIRKYAANPPTYAFGAEESAPTGALPTSVFIGPFGGPLGGPIQ